MKHLAAGSERDNVPLENMGTGAEKHRPASNRTNGASRIRTENQGIMSPLLPVPNPIPDLPFTSNSVAGCTAGCTSKKSEGEIPDAELAALLAAWPTLSVPIRAAIRALIGAVC